MRKADQQLDARNLGCPLPVLLTKKKLKNMQSGETLTVLTTDPKSIDDFNAFTTQTGNKLLQSKTIDGEFHFFLEKA